MKARVLPIIFAVLMIMSFAALVSCDYFVGFWDPLAMSSYYLYAACYSSDSVWAYKIDARTGALTKVGDYSQANASCLSADPTGQFLYVVDSVDRTVSLFSIDPGTGALSKVGEYATGLSPSSVTVDPSGDSFLSRIPAIIMFPRIKSTPESEP